MTSSLLVLSYLAISQSESGISILEKMVAYRANFATADIRWTQESRLSRRLYRRNRYAGKTWVYSEVGDPDGLVRSTQLGNPGAFSEVHTLMADGLQWKLTEHVPPVDVWEIDQDRGRIGWPVIDVRTFGILPELKANVTLDHAIHSILPEITPGDISVRDDSAGLKIVRARSGDMTISWWIDPSRGYSPVRVERESNGKTLSRLIIELAQYDGHFWFPKHIEQTEQRPDGPVVFKFNFESAEFDRPVHPARLTPMDIGVVYYNAVQWQGNRKGTGFWDGTIIVPDAEEYRRFKAGEINNDTLIAWHARIAECKAAQFGRIPAWRNEPHFGFGKPCDLDAWEIYVRRFGLTYKLDERQRNASLAVLSDCRKLAVAILPGIREKQEKEGDTARREALLRPIAEIFDRQLVPRLESLLTTPQSSQPTSSQFMGAPISSKPAQ